jgi:hypothetical protein
LAAVDVELLDRGTPFDDLIMLSKVFCLHYSNEGLKVYRDMTANCASSAPIIMARGRGDREKSVSANLSSFCKSMDHVKYTTIPRFHYEHWVYNGLKNGMAVSVLSTDYVCKETAN